MTDKTVIVTGIAGQDDPYLAALLLGEGYTKRDLGWGISGSMS